MSETVSVLVPHTACLHGVTYIVCDAKRKGEDSSAHLETTVGADDEPVFFALVADGHGGSAIAKMLAEALLPRIVAEARDASTAELERAMILSFEAMHTDARGAHPAAGSTATVVAIAQARGTITCANVGDSLAYGFSHGRTAKDKHPMHLATCHRLQDRHGERHTTEVEQVLAAGGQVGKAVNERGQAGGPLRAWPGGLAVSRSLGDADCDPWISATPSVCSYPLCHEHACDVLLATDGLWDALSLPRVYQLVERWPRLSRSAKDLVEQAIYTKGCVPSPSATSPSSAPPQPLRLPMCLPLLSLTRRPHIRLVGRML